MDEKNNHSYQGRKRQVGPSHVSVSITEPLNYPTESRFKFLLYFDINTIGETNKQMLS